MGTAAAVAGGHWDILRWVEEEDSRLPGLDDIFYSGISGDELYEAGDLGILQWANRIGLPVSLRGGARPAAEKGHLNILKWLWEVDKCEEEREEGEGTTIFEDIVLGAASGGYVETLRWAWENIPKSLKISIESLLWRAAHNVPQEESKYLGVFEFLIRKSEQAVSLDLMCTLGRNGLFPVIRWIEDHGFDPGQRDIELCSFATKHGDLEMLKWLRQRGYRWHSEIYLEVMSGMWGRKEGEGTTEEWELVDWMYENGCPWDEAVPAWALRSGTDEARVLKKMEWIKKKGLKWNPTEVFREAVLVRAMRVLDWVMKEREEEGRASVGVIYEQFADDRVDLNDWIKLIQWLQNYGISIPLDQIFHTFVLHSQVDALTWIMENTTYKAKPEFLDRFIEQQYGSVQPVILDWFHERGAVSIEHLKKICRSEFPRLDGVRMVMAKGWVEVDQELYSLLETAEPRAFLWKYFRYD
jgi:hypothetical protein